MFNYELMTMLNNETIDIQIMHIGDMFTKDQMYENFGLRIILEEESKIAGKTYALTDECGTIYYRKSILPASYNHQHFINELRTFVQTCNVAALIHMQDDKFLSLIVRHSENQMRYLEQLVRGEGYKETLYFVFGGGYRQIQDMLLAYTRLQ